MVDVTNKRRPRSHEDNIHMSMVKKLPHVAKLHLNIVTAI